MSPQVVVILGLCLTDWIPGNDDDVHWSLVASLIVEQPSHDACDAEHMVMLLDAQFN